MILQQLSNNWRALWSLDPHAIALGRIGLGLILVIDLISRLNQAELLYGAEAMAPVHMFIGGFPSIWSLYFLNDQLWFTQALIAFNLASAVAWMVGYRSKLALFITWFLYASLFYRNTLIHTGAEPTLLAALFWFLWLPHSHVWSLKRHNHRLNDASNQNCAIVSAGSIAFILQVTAYYFFSGLHKQNPVWWQEGSALYYALNLDIYTSSAGLWLRESPQLMQTFSFSIWWIEILAPALLLVAPLMFGRAARTFAALIFIGLHIGIAIFMQIGIFPYVNIAILLTLLPVTRSSSCFSQTGGTVLNWVKRQGVLLLVLLTFVACQAVFASYHVVNKKPPKALRTVLKLTTLENRLRFFAPRPPTKEHFWFTVGKLEDGREVDAFELSLTPPVIEKAHSIEQWNRFHQRYFVHLARKGKRAVTLRAHYARFLCDRWEANRQAYALPPLASVTLKYQLEITAEWQSGKPDFMHTARGHRFRCDK